MNANVKVTTIKTIDDKENNYVTIVTSKGTVNVSIGEKNFKKLKEILEGAISTVGNAQLDKDNRDKK